MAESTLPNSTESSLPDYEQVDDSFEEYALPWVTWLVILFCTMLWAYLNLGRDWSHYREVLHIMAPEGVRIWTGAVWGLVTAAFVHFDIWHILFTMWLAESFGRILEPTMGHRRYLLFILCAALVSSGMQLLLSGQTGMGFSGVIYAMFGYALAARRVYPQYQEIVERNIAQCLIGWLVLCLVLSAFKVMKISNEAHLAGLVFGLCVGMLFVRHLYVRTCRLILLLLVVMTVLSVNYLPWSEQWRVRHTTLELVELGERAEAGVPEAQYLYSNLMMRCAEGRAEGIMWLTKAADQGYLPAMNALARLLATDPNPMFRNAAQARDWALRLCEKDNWKHPMYVDTLATAYAEAEQWDVAITLQQRALERLGNEDILMKASFQERLQKYQRHEKVRE